MKPTGNLVADTICRTAEIGLTITGAADAGTITIIDATPVAVNPTCPDCGHPGKLRDHTLRRLVDLPVVGFPTRLDVRVPRFLCTDTSCPRKIFQASLMRTSSARHPSRCEAGLQRMGLHLQIDTTIGARLR